jgi:hypothetical protein
MFKLFKASSAINRRAEEYLYSIAYDEYEAGNIRKGLWAQAIAKAEGRGDHSGYPATPAGVSSSLILRAKDIRRYVSLR